MYSDSDGAPTQFVAELTAEPGIASVATFDAFAGTPTLGDLQQYDIVVPFSNSPFADAVVLGNNMADYVDGGGIVVQQGFSFYGPNQPYGLNGRWDTGQYSPYDYATTIGTATAVNGYFKRNP